MSDENGMTCWKCSRELAGHWSACPACGALSMENVEAVARGVASMAVRIHARRVELWGAEGETGWSSAHLRPSCSTPYAEHPTRHGAALAAFDAAWSEGRERLASDAITGWAAACDDPGRTEETPAPYAWGRQYMGEPSAHPALCDCGDAECPGTTAERFALRRDLVEVRRLRELTPTPETTLRDETGDR